MRLVVAAFQLAVGKWGMSPRDFWELHPEEFWLIVEARQPVKMYGKMTEAEVAQICAEDFGELPGSSD